MDSVGHTLGWILFILGWVLTFFGSLWIIVLGWQRNIYWGVVCFFIPIVQLVYVAFYWKESKEAFFLLMAGFVLVILGGLAEAPGF